MARARSPGTGPRDRCEDGRSRVQRPSGSGDGREHRDLRCWSRCTRRIELERRRGRSRRHGRWRVPAIQRDLPAQDLRRRLCGERAGFAGRAVALWRKLGAASQALGHPGMKGRMEGGRKKRGCPPVRSRPLAVLVTGRLVTRSSRRSRDAARVPGSDAQTPRLEVPRLEVPDTSLRLECPARGAGSRCQTPRYGHLVTSARRDTSPRRRTPDEGSSRWCLAA